MTRRQTEIIAKSQEIAILFCVKNIWQEATAQKLSISLVLPYNMRKPQPLAVAVIWMLVLVGAKRSAATLAASAEHTTTTLLKANAVVVGSVRASSSCFVQSRSDRHCHCRRSARTNFKAPSSSSPPCYNRSNTAMTTCRRLFFRATTDVPNPRRPRQKVAPPDWALKQLISRDICIPFAFPSNNDNANKKTTSTLTIRCMTEDDFDTIVPMCITEFGTGPTLSLTDFPWKDPTDRKLADWWDRIYFEPMVTMALKAKLLSNKGRRLLPPFGDPTVLVLTRHEIIKDDKDDTIVCPAPVVVGMVELGKQVPESTKNPPAFPIPTWCKQLYCRLTGMPLEGWVTNLLIGKEHRGLGYSKILMAATEGIAKSWNVGSIYLHADADRATGKVPQSLYEGLGYQVVVTDNPQFEWMGGDFNSRIHIVEGVPLLFLRKRLKQ
jgi:ribosomal protein S18 acetylase RimI-like enzyme